MDDLDGIRGHRAGAGGDIFGKGKGTDRPTDRYTLSMQRSRGRKAPFHESPLDTLQFRNDA